MNKLRYRILAVGSCLVLLLALGLILAPTSVRAGHIGEREVRTAVETWVRYVTADARPDAVVERMEPYQVEGKTVAYIAHLKGGGFCLASADDRLAPVYLYSPSGNYDPLNPNYRFVLDDIAWRQRVLLDRSFTLAPDELAASAAIWEDLIVGRVPKAPIALASPVSMVLPLTSLWHQESPYNDQCPVLTPGSDEHVVVGCVATAVAQIMYYWQWPPMGTGSDSVTYERRYRTTWDTEPLASDPGIPAGWTGRLEYDSVNHRLRMNGWWDFSLYTAAQGINKNSTAYQNALAALWSRMSNGDLPLTVNMGAATYNWGILKDTNNDPPDPAANEAAKISYHTAVGVYMYFGVNESSANGGGARSALADHFRYSPSVAALDPPVASTLVNEIQWLRPVFLGGMNTNDYSYLRGGHAWVAFGYNTATNPVQFLMNFGWPGTPTAWYSLDQRFPDLQASNIYIAPLNVKFVGAADSGDGSPDNPYQGIEEAIAGAPDGATLIFKAGSYNAFAAAPLVINRPLTLKGWDVTITK